MKMITILCFSMILALLTFSCSEKKSVADVGTHPTGWTDQNSEQFHGTVVIDAGNEGCTACHGSDFQGGTSEVSCYSSECHEHYPHPPGISDVNSESFHGQYIKNSLGWDMIPCQSCHGEDYDREIQETSCRSCHTGPDGPEECNTCHGSPTNDAPPRDLSKNITHTFLGVGAHQIHVAETQVARLLDCTRCHLEVLSYDDPNHIDDGIASVIFDTLGTDGGRLTPVWDRNNATCSEVYCHGAFRFGSNGQIRGNNNPVTWTEKNPDPAACDLCHGLPPQGHFGGGVYTTPESCNQCHGSVVNSDGEIENPELHINRKENFN